MNKKEAILRSVLKLVNREGFYHLNMKKIAAEAGVATGTIYIYFKGKEELINDLYLLAITEFNDSVMKAYEQQDNVKDSLMAMVSAALEFYIKNPDHFSFIEQYTYSPFLFKENRGGGFALLKPIYTILSEGKKQKLIDDIPDEVLVAIIHGSITTIMKLYLGKKIDLRKKENTKEFYDAIWGSVTQKKI